ncbi:hypothetical protein G7A66_07235 [Altererythrobacter sp. SALINAS58]|uniref:hypothetical protein n=1 Tax=Alteripontixanthobacter muriae TaxID=2705546 RepID=UPI001576E480|nr:hypothetical protein [Alteripontixanthobacter muriae]NTZ42883.1 hypothetical protein [Alteripontixanthobacter muriae]
MLVIRTAEEMARALDSPIHPELKQPLAAHWERLSEYEGYDLSELAEFAIVEPGDTLQDLSEVIEVQLGEGGVAPAFSLTPEIVEQHESWTELVFIYSDDGFGLVLFIPTAFVTDPLISELAKRHLNKLAAH